MSLASQQRLSEWQKTKKPKPNLAKTRELRNIINHEEHVEAPPLAPENRRNRNKRASQRQLKSTLDVRWVPTDQRVTPRVGTDRHERQQQSKAVDAARASDAKGQPFKH